MRFAGRARSRIPEPRLASAHQGGAPDRSAALRAALAGVAPQHRSMRIADANRGCEQLARPDAAGKVPFDCAGSGKNS
jgi:hypothetical protein